jgi:hypothetical protein
MLKTTGWPNKKLNKNKNINIRIADKHRLDNKGNSAEKYSMEQSVCDRDK